MGYFPRSEGGGDTGEIIIYILRLRLESMDDGGVNGGRWVYEGGGGRGVYYLLHTWFKFTV